MSETEEEEDPELANQVSFENFKVVENQNYSDDVYMSFQLVFYVFVSFIFRDSLFFQFLFLLTVDEI